MGQSLNGSGCEFLLTKGDSDDSFDLLVRDRERRDIVQFKGVWLFHLEDMAKEVLLKEMDSYSTLEVIEEVLKGLEHAKLGSLFQALPDDRLRILENIIHQVVYDSV